MTDAPTADQGKLDAAAEEFDVFGWLGDTQQANDSIELYNSGPVLNQLSKLTQGLAEVEEQRKAQAAYLERMPGAITDDETLGDQAIRDQIEELRTKLKGTGVTFNVQAITPGEREVLSETVARRFKAVPSKGTLGEDDYEAAIPGGDGHPDYNKAFTSELVARSILSVTSPTGAVSKKKWDAKGVQKLRSDLPAVEYLRLSNAVFTLTYLQYDIEQMFDVDFS